MKFTQAFVVTHIAYRTNAPFDPLEGPYTSVCNALVKMKCNISTLQIPLFDFSVPIRFGPWKKENVIAIPSFLGIFVPFKYMVDIFITFAATIRFFRNHSAKKTLIVAIDPLSCFALCLLKPLYRYTLVFYSVDFNGKRFDNALLKFLYEIIDAFCSKHADVVWAVCEALVAYKKKKYHVTAFYIPNSNQFDPALYRLGKDKRTGNKICWTGSCITLRQFTILFSVLEKIQKIRPDVEFHFAPVGNYTAFKENCKKYGLKKWTVYQLHSRRAWQEFAATCDIGIAVYDDTFGSTRFIEPLKIWDFLLCGLPFIISSEPSLGRSIKKSGAAYVLSPHNQIPKDNSLKKFLNKKNLGVLQTTCIQLAKEFDIKVQIEKSLSH